MKVQQKPEIFSRKVGSVWLLLEPNKKYIRHLNQTAGYIWSLAKKPVSLTAISHDVAEKFTVSQREAEQDAKDFVLKYLHDGFLQEIK